MCSIIRYSILYLGTGDDEAIEESKELTRIGNKFKLRGRVQVYRTQLQTNVVVRNFFPSLYKITRDRKWEPRKRVLGIATRTSTAYSI